MARYKIAVAGDPNWAEIHVIAELFVATKVDYKHLEIIHGGRRGAEKLVKEWADARGVVARNYRSYWGRYKYPSPNEYWQDMLEIGKPDEFWTFHNDIDSGRGYKFMMREAIALGIPTFLIRGYDLEGRTKAAYAKLQVTDVKSVFTSPSYDLKILT